MKIFFRVWLLLLILACSSGIEPIDDQRNLPLAYEECVNPPPVQRDFLLNNTTHRVLAAIIDTGVDYNHPALLNNIHFSLNSANEPTGAGWDFIGGDAWPAPYVGRRSIFFEGEVEFFEGLTASESEFKEYFERCRNVVQEYSASAKHGTALAGLVAQNIPEIGLVIFRSAPPNRGEFMEGYAIGILENILKSMSLALQQGANVVLITSFFAFEKQGDKDFERALELKRSFERFIRKHNDVLFVVSAGNCARFRYSSEEDDFVVLPAGIAAPNLIVVGSLSEEGTISNFSNVPCGDLHAVFAPGENILTITPTKMLHISRKHLWSIIYDLDSLLGENYYSNIAQHLRLCLEDGGGVPESGTSFAAALAAHLCLKMLLDSPELTPEELVSKLQAVLNSGESE
jgi:subtilisin family serine protease